MKWMSSILLYCKNCDIIIQSVDLFETSYLSLASAVNCYITIIPKNSTKCN